MSSPKRNRPNDQDTAEEMDADTGEFNVEQEEQPRTPSQRSRPAGFSTPVRPVQDASEDQLHDMSSPPLQPMPDMSDRGSQRPPPSSPSESHVADSASHADLFSSPRLNYPARSPGDRSFVSRSDIASPRRRIPRSDVGSSTRFHRQVDLEDDIEPGSRERHTSGGTGVKNLILWGTNVSVDKLTAKFRQFIETFKAKLQLDEDEIGVRHELGEALSEIDPAQPYYLQRLQEAVQMGEFFLGVNLQHVREFDESLYRQMVTYPNECIPYIDRTLTQVVQDLLPDEEFDSDFEIRPFNADKTRNMRGLNPSDIDQMITICGMVIRTSSLIPDMKAGFFECTVCKNSLQVNVDNGRIEEPTLCQQCNTNHCFQLIHNRSLFSDKQLVKLQESPDDMPPGQTPHTVTLFCFNDLVDSVQPGDRVIVTGIFRAVPLRVNPRMRTVKSVYRTFMDVLHFRKTDVHRLHQQQDGCYMSKERIQQIMELSQKPDIYERLAHALAPSIYEHEDIKKGILCLLFGGAKKDFSTAGRGRFRAELNILLCGDPGTSKSQLLQYVHGLVPRGQYTSGKGSSAVGLTAYMTKDPDTRQMVLQTGALVLSDNGICCIDEFDKMNDNTRSVLHEVMEQQTLSIAKAGIICQLNARASILAAANPVDSQWNRNKTIIENVQLPHTLLSRFDLIFLMVDPQDEFYDRRLATHLVSLYYKTQEEEETEFLDMSLIRDYIAYAKDNINPVLTEEASQNLIDKYVNMRKVGSGKGQVSAYPRQLESLIRLSEARAKIRLSKYVENQDVDEADRLHREALKQSAIDPLTGKVDVGILAVGLSTATRRQITDLMSVIKKKLKDRLSGVPYKQLLVELRQESDRMITREIFDEALSELRKQDAIVKDVANRVKLAFRAEPGVADDVDEDLME